MPLVPPTPEHHHLPMEVVEAKLTCSKGYHSIPLTLPIDKQSLIEDWPRRQGQFLTLEWRLKCQHPDCDYTMNQRFDRGRIPLGFIPGTYENRVFVGGNYDSMSRLRNVKSAIFAVKPGFVPILPFDDFQLSRGEIHDWDLRLLHNCKYAIFDVTDPRGELMEIERCAEYKLLTLLLYDSREPVPTPLIGHTMLLESGRHEHHSYGDTSELKPLVEEFLLQKDPEGFRRAREMIGYSFANCVWKHKIYPNGVAEHEYSYYGLKVDVPNFRLTQVTHTCGFSSGSFTSFEPRLNSGATWKPDNTRSTERAKHGLVSFDPPLELSSDPMDYSFKAQTKGAYILHRKDLKKLPEDQKDNPVLSAGREYHCGNIAWPMDAFHLSMEFPKGYNLLPMARAYCGAEPRSDAIRIPPDTFDFANNVATLTISRPMFNFRYCIEWEVPESPP